MAYLERDNDGRIYYESYGRGDSAVVLVHGWGMGLRAWDYSLQALLKAGYRVVALDHRGCGASDKDFADMGIDAIAGDVVGLVDALELNRVVLNGWSLGGAGLVLTCGATPVYLQKSDFPHGGTDQALADTLAAMGADRVNFLAALSQGVCASAVSDRVVSWMWQMFMQASPQAATTLAELGPLDQRSALASLRIPILSFVGGKDAVVDPCRSVGTFNAGARIIEYEHAGHAPFIDETARYNADLINFIGDCL
jgi:non-heme chloroperoxidase